MNTLKDCIVIHFQQIWIDASEVVLQLLNNLSDKVCVPNNKEDLNLSMPNMITGIDELETLRKHISCECKRKFDRRKCNSNQKKNNAKCRCECKYQKEHRVCKKDYISSSGTWSCKSGKYLASIIDNSVIVCNETISTTKTFT